MRRVLSWLLALAIAWLIGHFLVASLWRARPRDGADRLLRAAAAFGLGMGLEAVLDFLWIVAFGKASRGVVLVDLGVLVLAAVAERLTRRPATTTAGGVPRGFGWFSGSVGLLFTALALGIVGTMLLRAPSGAWDAIAIWNLHAQFFNAQAAGGWQALFDRVMEHSRPDYPPLLPAAVARGWLYAGQSIPLVPMTVAFGFTLALLALVTGAVAGARGGNLGALACAVLAGSPIFLGTALSQYADLPLAFYFLLAVALLQRADEEEDGHAGLHVLAGLAAGLAALTKNEGSLFLVALGAGRGLHLLLAGRVAHRLRNVAWLGLGVAPLVGVLLLYKSFTPANYFFSGQGKDFWQKLLSAPRALLIINDVRVELERPHSFSVGYVQKVETWHWHLLASSLFVLLFGIDSRRLGRGLCKWGLRLVMLGSVADIVGTRLVTGAFHWHWGVAIVAAIAVVALGFDPRRLKHPSFLAALTTLLIVNAGYFVVYMLTPLDLHWQLMFSIERLLFHTMPLGIFVAFLAMASWERRGFAVGDSGSGARLLRGLRRGRPSAAGQPPSSTLSGS